MPSHATVRSALYETVNEHGHKRKQKEAEEPKNNGKEENKEMIITTHFFMFGFRDFSRRACH